MWLILLLYALFASVFTISKDGLQYIQPLFLIGSRMMVAGILMLGYQFLFQNQPPIIHRKDWKRILLLAAFNIYLTNALEFWGLQYLTSFKTCFIYSLCPFLSALFSYWAFSEKMNVKKWIGLFIGFAGFIPVLMSEGSEEERTFHIGSFSWPELSVMLAAMCSVYGWVVLRQLVKENGYTPMTANGLAMFFGGAMALIHSLLVENWNPIPTTDYIRFLECALLLIIISNFICYNLYGYLLKRFTATSISFAGWITPLFTALFGWIFLQEQVTWPFILSAAIVLIGLFLFYQEELKQGYILRKKKQFEIA